MRELAKADLLDELVHDVREILERVFELRVIRHTALAEAGIVRRHQAKRTGEAGNEVPEHVRRSGEPVQEQDDGGGFRSGFAVENIQIVDVNSLVVDGILCADRHFQCRHGVLSIHTDDLPAAGAAVFVYWE